MVHSSLSLLTGLRRWSRPVLTLVAVIGVGGLLFRGAISYAREIALFDLRRIEVRGNHILTRAEVIEALALPLSGSVFEIDLPTLQARLEALNYVHGVRLGRRFPHTLYVDLVENQPLAYVAASEYFVLTGEGEALALPHGRFELELPTVAGIETALSSLEAGTIAGHVQLQQAWKILRYIHASFPSLYQELSEIVFDDGAGITLFLTDHSTAIRLGDHDFEQRIALLDAFLLTVMGKRNLMDYSYIDLRYERQVVVRERV